jgi:hypothetical protein
MRCYWYTRVTSHMRPIQFSKTERVAPRLSCYRSLLVFRGEQRRILVFFDSLSTLFLLFFKAEQASNIAS